MKLILGFVVLAAAGCASTPRRAEPPRDSYTTSSVVLATAGGPKTITATRVGRAFFQATDAPVLGRLLLPADYAGGVAVALLSEQLWRDAFGARPTILGTKIQAGGDSLIVVGVLPRTFDSPPGTGIWLARKDSTAR